MKKCVASCCVLFIVFCLLEDGLTVIYPVERSNSRKKPEGGKCSDWWMYYDSGKSGCALCSFGKKPIDWQSGCNDLKLGDATYAEADIFSDYDDVPKCNVSLLEAESVNASCTDESWFNTEPDNAPLVALGEKCDIRCINGYTAALRNPVTTIRCEECSTNKEPCKWNMELPEVLCTPPAVTPLVTKTWDRTWNGTPYTTWNGTPYTTWNGTPYTTHNTPLQHYAVMHVGVIVGVSLTVAVILAAMLIACRQYYKTRGDNMDGELPMSYDTSSRADLRSVEGTEQRKSLLVPGEDVSTTDPVALEVTRESSDRQRSVDSEDSGYTTSPQEPPTPTTPSTLTPIYNILGTFNTNLIQVHNIHTYADNIRSMTINQGHANQQESIELAQIEGTGVKALMSATGDTCESAESPFTVAERVESPFTVAERVELPSTVAEADCRPDIIKPYCEHVLDGVMEGQVKVNRHNSVTGAGKETTNCQGEGYLPKAAKQNSNVSGAVAISSRYRDSGISTGNSELFRSQVQGIGLPPQTDTIPRTKPRENLDGLTTIQASLDYGEVAIEPSLFGDLSVVASNTQQKGIAGGVTDQHSVQGAVTQPYSVAAVTQPYSVAAGVTQRQGMAGGVTDQHSVQGAVTQPYSVAGGVTQRQGIADGVTDQHSVQGTVTQPYSVAGGITQQQGIAGGVTDQHSLTGAVTHPYSAACGVTQPYSGAGGVTQPCSVVDGVMQSHSLRGDLPNQPSSSNFITSNSKVANAEVLPLPHVLDELIKAHMEPPQYSRAGVQAELSVSDDQLDFVSVDSKDIRHCPVGNSDYLPAVDAQPRPLISISSSAKTDVSFGSATDESCEECTSQYPCSDYKQFHTLENPQNKDIKLTQYSTRSGHGKYDSLGLNPELTETPNVQFLQHRMNTIYPLAEDHDIESFPTYQNGAHLLGPNEGGNTDHTVCKESVGTGGQAPGNILTMHPPYLTNNPHVYGRAGYAMPYANQQIPGAYSQPLPGYRPEWQPPPYCYETGAPGGPYHYQFSVDPVAHGGYNPRPLHQQNSLPQYHSQQPRPPRPLMRKGGITINADTVGPVLQRQTISVTGDISEIPTMLHHTAAIPAANVEINARVVGDLTLHTHSDVKTT